MMGAPPPTATMEDMLMDQVETWCFDSVVMGAAAGGAAGVAAEKGLPPFGRTREEGPSPGTRDQQGMQGSCFI